MTYDRLIEFKKKEGPTEAEIVKVLENLIGGAGIISWPTDVRQSKDHKCLSVVLPGNPTNALDGISPVLKRGRLDLSPLRGFRVWYHPVTRNSIDVATSHQDEFTSAIANMAAKVFARYWEGEYNDEG